MKKGITKILIAALAAATVSTMAVVPAFAVNNVISDGTWVGSDAVAADPEHGVAANEGTAIKTNATITVTDVEDSSSTLEVVAYQVVKGTYKDNKLTGYVLCDATNAAIADLEAPTVSEITTIANNIRANATTLQGIKMTKGTGANAKNYTATVEAGLYVVLATGADSYVYNPAIVAVNVADANDLDNDGAGNDGKTKPIDHDGDPETPKEKVDNTSVSMTSYWTIPTQAYLKSSTTSLQKTVIGSSSNTGTAADAEKTLEDPHGDIAAKGDRIYFKIDDITIPTYTDEYAKPVEGVGGVVFQIADQLESPSFAGISRFTVTTYEGYWDDDDDPSTPDVKKNPTAVAAANYTIVYKDKDGETITDNAKLATDAVSYTIKFNDQFLRDNAAKALEITYDTVLTDEANVNFEANRTTAALQYTVDPNNNNGTEVIRDTARVYTFGVGENIDGTTGSKVKPDGVDDPDDYIDPFIISEINKVSEKLADTATEYTEHTTITGEGEIYYSSSPVEGAVFTLYDDAAFTTIHQLWTSTGYVNTSASDEYGRLVLSGLDVGTYYLKETAAPAGYTINETDYKLVVEGTVEAITGKLTGYVITMSYKDASGNWVEMSETTISLSSSVVDEPDTDADAGDLDTIVNVVTIEKVGKPAEVVDTELAALPSTGGVGTIALTIVAAVGMGGFLTLYLVNKKKKNSVEE